MRPRSIWRIARWEAAGQTGGIDRRTLAFTIVGLLVLGLLIPATVTVGPAANADIYQVGIGNDHRYHDSAQAATALAVVPPDQDAFEAGRLDVLVSGETVHIQDDPTGRAAASTLRSAVERYNDRLMRAEPDRAAAFPVAVQLRYVQRDVGILVQRTDETPGSRSANGGSDGSQTPSESTSTPADDNDGVVLDRVSIGGTSLFPQRVAGTPASITPPFPFASLVLAFLFVIPMNFVVQAYASSVLHDRGNRRGEPLLVAPVSRWSVIAGKALPYFGVMVAIAAVTAAAVGGGLLAVYGTIPIALVFLGGGFLAALFARSHKELTFVLVAISVGLTTFVFVPAIFADVHPIAAISPLSLVVRDLEGSTVGVGTILFSTGPTLLAAFVLYGLGGGLYREEDLFAQVPPPRKALDALAAFVTKPSRVAWASLLSIPFVFMAELLVVALLFMVPLEVALPTLFVTIAFIEELAKSLPAYAGFEHGRYDRTVRVAVIIGGYSGLGFFLGEKAAAVAQVVGLFELDIGRVAFELGAGVGGASTPAVLAALVILPLGLHSTTAAITAYGASRDAGWYTLTLAVAVGIHAAYNLGVVTILG